MRIHGSVLKGCYVYGIYASYYDVRGCGFDAVNVVFKPTTFSYGALVVSAGLCVRGGAVVLT